MGRRRPRRRGGRKARARRLRGQLRDLVPQSQDLSPEAQAYMLEYLLGPGQPPQPEIEARILEMMHALTPDERQQVAVFIAVYQTARGGTG